MHYERTTLHNGLRLLTARMPGMRSASLAFFLRVGSRYESDELAGISHFIEHMLFKGSQHYPSARNISEAIEGVGGVFNGSTGKEMTSYTVRVPGERLDDVLRVFADMLRFPRFERGEIEKERQVIIEELSSTRDDPEEWSSLLIDETMWPGLPLGRDDGGREETVAALQREQMLRYLDEHYRPNALVICAAGNVEPAHVSDLVEQTLGDWEPRSLPSWTESLPPRDATPVRLIQKETEQTNLCLCTLGVAHASPDYYPLMLINALLGDGMSSRLFQAIREEQGLAYDIGSYYNSYYETGNLVISAGVDPSQTEATIAAIVQELNTLCNVPVPNDELERARAYLQGSLILGMEGTQQVASWLGGQECLHNEIIEVDEMIAHIDAVSSHDIQRVAQLCFAPEWRRLASIGPEPPRRARRFRTLLTGV
jgi:predicted Zn-dependent peptidase